MRYDRRHNKADSSNRYCRQRIADLLCDISKQLIDKQAKRYRDDHDLNDRQEHRPNVNAYGRSKIKIRQQRGQERGKQSIYTCHSHRKGCIAFGKIGYDIARSPSRASPHDHDPDKELIVKPEQLSKRKGQQRHNDKLCQTTDHDIARPFEHDRKIRQLHCHSHSEHDDHQKISDPPCLYPQAGLWQQQRQSSDDQNHPRHIFTKHLTYFLHFTSVPICRFNAPSPSQ